MIDSPSGCLLTLETSCGAALRPLSGAPPRLQLHGERGAFDRLLARLQQGLVSGQEAAEALELMRRALGLTGIALSQEWAYDPWSQIAGDLGDWPRVYQRRVVWGSPIYTAASPE